MKEKILIITYEMIPYSNHWGGCQRMYYLADFLIQNKFDVRMISSLKENVGYFGKEINFDILYLPYLKIKNEGIKTEIKNSAIIKMIKTIVKKLEKIIFNEPISGIGLFGYLWSRKSEKKILEYIKSNNIKKVIISVPPFSLLTLINPIKKSNEEIKVIFDFRDPWNTKDDNKGISSFREKNLLKKADKIIVATESVKNEKMKKFEVNPEKVEIILNGYSSEDWNKIENQETGTEVKNKIVISYLGSIDFKGCRDTTTFFNAYDKLGDMKKFVKLRFIGILENEESKKLKMTYPEIDFIGKVSPEKAMIEMLKSDVLLNFHTLNDNSFKFLISAKIFDYIKSNKIIYSITDEESLVSQLIREKELGLTANNIEKEILEKFEIIINNFKTGTLDKLRKNKDLNIDFYSRENQNKKYVEILTK